MAALSSAVGPALLSGASVGLNLLQRSQDLQAAEAEARRRARTAEADAQLRLDDLRAQQAADSAQRRDALRRAQARAQALLGARGAGTGSGSGAAVLQGLAAETARDAAFADQEFALKADGILQGADSARERDLLALADRRRRAQLDSLRDGLGLTGRLNLL
ncbi:MAG: hypothetical protein H6844_05615 [Alphaproteobacteria bacterium]|nr:hypothetical protein [Alphaproteobacteria bacterium]